MKNITELHRSAPQLRKVFV